jgi:hypothetical protein
VEQWQAELIGRIVERVDACRAGQISLARLVEDSRGLFDAADISDNAQRAEFESVWAPVSGELDLRGMDWTAPGWISDDRLGVALDELRSWATRVAASASSPRPPGRVLDDSTVQALLAREEDFGSASGASAARWGARLRVRFPVLASFLAMAVAAAIAGGLLVFGSWTLTLSDPADRHLGRILIWLGGASGLIVGVVLAVYSKRHERLPLGWKPRSSIASAAVLGMVAAAFRPRYVVGAVVAALGALLCGIVWTSGAATLFGRFPRAGE